MATLRAKRLPINQPVAFTGSLADLRAANGLDPDLSYVEAYTCPADGYLVESITGYVAPDGRVYCTRDCANEMAMIAEMEEGN